MRWSIRSISCISSFVSLVAVGNVPAFAQVNRPRLVSVIADMDTTRTHHLTDGTVLKQTFSSRFIRDADGRTRIEQDGRVFINDPIQRHALILNPVHRTAYKAAPGGVPAAPTPQPQPDKQSDMQLKAELGQRIIEGITVTGKEWSRTIPAHSTLGNDRPIEQNFTVWHSRELGLAVRTIVHSPLTGILETGFRNIQTNIAIDQSLFEVPPEYAIVDRPTP